MPKTVEKLLRFLQMLDNVKEQHAVEITQVQIPRLFLVPNTKALEHIRLRGQVFIHANHATPLLGQLSCEAA
jgi:hypothetical protein